MFDLKSVSLKERQVDSFQYSSIDVFWRTDTRKNPGVERPQRGTSEEDGPVERDWKRKSAKVSRLVLKMLPLRENCLLSLGLQVGKGNVKM